MLKFNCFSFSNFLAIVCNVFEIIIPNKHNNPSKINIEKLYMLQSEKFGIILKQHNSINNIDIEKKIKRSALLLLGMKKLLLQV